ncbi:prealbumin-like fold domain-containing protein [Mumia sp. DW29H23]|uniref:prealbumin-like fold domain-containing protein n=1 Tax=Mumia sp. DW29H23 TaxID=3421241 RepID=UPI003D6958B5
MEAPGRPKVWLPLLAALVLVLGLAGAATPSAAAPTLAPQVVPPATGNNAVITVKVGGDRAGTTAVTNLAGVTLQLYDGGPGGATTPVADAWATCVSDDDGDCSFVVPNAQTNAIGTCTGANAGANCDRRFWVVQTGAPAGYTINASFRTGNGDGTGSETTDYEFRTGTTLRAGNTYSSTSAFMVGTGNTNRVASGGVWQQSRTNPAPLQQCGLNVALILDLSGSVTAPQLVQLKGAADTFTNSLVGTPSQMALFSFSTGSPALGATQNFPGLTSVATQAGADAFKARYQAWTAGGGTNWDRGLAVPAQANPTYDIAVVITDGNPTYYSQPAEGPGNFTRIREMENGVFSANAMKARGTRVLAVGVGAGVSDTATGQNLRAISGPVQYNGTNAATADYYQVANYAVVGAALRQLALGECAGSLSVVKQIVGPDGNIADATPGGAGWTFDASTTTPNVTLPTPSATTDASSAVNFPITFGGGTTSGAIQITEEEQDGSDLFPVNGANGVCTNLETGAAISVTNAGATGFVVNVPSTAAVSCIVYNQAVAPATVTVEKEWAINGAPPVPNGSQPSGMRAQLTLTGPGDAGASNQDWGVTRPGYSEGDTVTVDEEVFLEPPGVDPDLCTVGDPQIVEINGESGAPIPFTDGFDHELTAGANTLTVRNTVDCESRLTLAKEVDGTADPTLWDLAALPAPGTPAGQLPGPAGEAGSAEVTDQVVSPLIPYQLAESGGLPEYLQDDFRTNQQTYPLSTGSWTCIRVDAEGNQIPGYNDGLNGGVTVPVAARVQCTATNRTGRLVLVKDVVNDDGGTAVPSDFTLSATPTDEPPVDGLQSHSDPGSATGTTYEVRPDHPYLLAESAVPGYALVGVNCLVLGEPRDLRVVTVEAGQTVECTFTNDDQPAELTLRKVVDAGTTGATDTSADWTLTATPDGIAGQDPVSGNGADGVTDQELFAGTYDLTEDGPDGYDAGDWVCEGEGGTLDAAALTLASGADVTCTITNTAQQPTLTLVKDVVNDNGGTAKVGEWTLTATGPTAGVTGATGTTPVTDRPVEIGSYALSESGPAGYEGSAWVCTADGASLPVVGGSVSVALGQDVVCTITNDDQPATLTLVKELVNDNGGTAEATDWTLSAEGPTPISGASGDTAVTNATVDAGAYDLSESGGPDGYQASEWDCGDAVLQGVTVTVPNGGAVTCTVTNDDEPGTLTLVKQVVNDDGGTAEAIEWTLSAAGPTPITGVTGDDAVTGATVNAGAYDLSESDGPAGYAAGAWTCIGGALEGGSVTVPNGGTVTCTIVNDDLPATLTLVKEVVNDNGGTAEATEWTLSADGPDALAGVTGSVGVTGVTVEAGEYALAEDGGPPGYTASDWDCGGAVVAASIVTVPNGADVTCTITNTFDAPTLTLVKEVVNDDGGAAQATAWTLTATGPNTLTGVTGSDAVTGVAVSPGAYALDETGPSGYTASDWACANRGSPIGLEGATVTLAPGDDVTCTITNDDDAVPPASTWTVVKTSDPGSGSEVDPGDVVTYTVRAGVVSGTSVDAVVVVDDLARVLNHATLVAGSVEASVGTATVTGSRLRWEVGTLTGTQTLTYRVKVDDDAFGVSLVNVVTGDGAEPCPPEGPELADARAAAPGDEDCRTTTHATPTEPPSTGGPDLPGTGGPAGWISGVALLLLVAGAYLLARRRRESPDVDG